MTATTPPAVQIAPVLTAVDLRVEIGGIELTRVSLEVAAGECLAIVGESGSGKTLTARALLGLAPEGARVSAERLVVGGVDTAGFGEAQWRDIRGRLVALVSQDALVSLDPLRRIGREVAEPIEVHRPAERDVPRRVIELLDLVAVPEAVSRARQYPHELSGGLRQRALIASALAGEPVLLVADEPTTALDSTVQSQVLALLGQLKQQGLAVLLVSHDLAAVARLADRIAVMHEGRIVEQGLASTVLERPRHEVTRALLASLPHARRRPAVTTGPVVLEAHGLQRRYPLPEGGERVAVADVALRLRAGATLGVVGESGSGKSTIARMLLALERPDAGSVLLGGEPWSALPERARTARRGRIQLIDQDPFSAFDPRWRVGRALAEALALDGVPRRARPARSRELLAMVGLDRGILDRRPSTLSGGQRQRVAIARALARRPEVLVCDEPVSALDATVRAQVLALLESLQDRFGLAIVIISHDLGVVRQLSDEVIVLRDGRVVEQGPADSVLGAPTHAFTRRLIAAAAQP